ncbi:MAG: diaminopimelate decarboxylase [Minisyncoccia bacterium]
MYTNYFHYENGELFGEGVRIKDIVKKVGTPVYIYVKEGLENQYRILEEAFSGIPHLICYSVKACSNLSILKLFKDLGAGVDVISGGELYRALSVGINPDKIVFSGPGKTKEEIEYAIRSGIKMLNVESHQELELIDFVAGELKKKAPIAIRIKPDIDPKTLPAITTGLMENKFGIAPSEIYEVYQDTRKFKNLEVVGIHMHIGSQILDIEPLIEAVERMAHFVEYLKGFGFNIVNFDIGGGLGIPYREEDKRPDVNQLAQRIKKILPKNCFLIGEYGRFLTAEAGILVTKVLYVKTNPSPFKKFVIVDAGMNDLIRPALYSHEGGGYHQIIPLENPEREMEIVDIVGPICESDDFFAKNRLLQKVSSGEFLAICDAGAYGFSMSSQYNSRPRPAEVLIEGKDFRIIRERESFDDLIKGEKI